MKIELLILSILAIVFISGCTEQPNGQVGITNFDECIAAGNPVMESYPRQCMYDGKTFTEEVPEPPMPPEDENMKAVNMANQVASGLESTIISDERTTMSVSSVTQSECEGCWAVELEYKLIEEGSDRIQKATVKVTIENWEVADTSYSQVTDIALTSQECEAEGGRIAIIADGKGCSEDEAEMGDVIELVSPGVCCIPNKTYCTEEQRNTQACTMEYRPVCGWFDESIQCVKYPCADTYSNPCIACSDEKVEYWTEGECPK